MNYRSASSKASNPEVNSAGLSGPDKPAPDPIRGNAVVSKIPVFAGMKNAACRRYLNGFTKAMS
jgi:hypothetical protein